MTARFFRVTVLGAFGATAPPREKDAKPLDRAVTIFQAPSTGTPYAWIHEISFLCGIRWTDGFFMVEVRAAAQNQLLPTTTPPAGSHQHTFFTSTPCTAAKIDFASAGAYALLPDGENSLSLSARAFRRMFFRAHLHAVGRYHARLLQWLRRWREVCSVTRATDHQAIAAHRCFCSSVNFFLLALRRVGQLFSSVGASAVSCHHRSFPLPSMVTRISEDRPVYLHRPERHPGMYLLMQYFKCPCG